MRPFTSTVRDHDRRTAAPTPQACAPIAPLGPSFLTARRLLGGPDAPVPLNRANTGSSREGTLMRRLLLSIVPALALVLFPATVAHAQPERHCVVVVTGQLPSGEFTTAPQQCYATGAE